MLLDPRDWSLAHRIDDVLPGLPPALAAQVTPETHGAALELATHPHPTASAAARELEQLRARLAVELDAFGLRAASAGTHPFALWNDTRISSGERYQAVYGSMRELARREPTFALHVHVGVSDPEDAIFLHNRLRAHLPLLLGLSANSPFWQGRDTGLTSARTSIFQAFPRVGIPRAFASYADYVETVDLMLRCGAFPEPTFLWWDIRPQPRFGTLEVRIMDAQLTAADAGALAALVQSIARLELEQGYHADQLIEAPEVLAENRFIAARDGMNARLLDPTTERLVPARELLAELVQAVRPHSVALGCGHELDAVHRLAEQTGAARQLRVTHGREHLPDLVEWLSSRFLDSPQPRSRLQQLHARLTREGRRPPTPGSSVAPQPASAS